MANQDAVASLVGGSGADRGDLFMVADGMGGHAAGELASQIATDCIPHAYRKQSDLPPPAALKKAIRKANATIHSKGQGDPDLTGMGTTCSCLVMVSGFALIAHVGDSRVYRLRGGKLEQLTADHSLVWEVAKASHVTTDKVPACIPKNYITRSLGPQDTVDVDIEGPHELQAGDVFLVCSDGLNAVVEDNVIGAIIGALPPEEATQTLIDLANLRGGPDNISIVVIAVEADTPDDASDEEPGEPPPLGALARATRAAWNLTGRRIWAMLRGGRPAVVNAPPPMLSGSYGEGPYREVGCLPGEPAAGAIGAVVDELAELEAMPAPHSGPLIDDWQAFRQHRQQAAESLQSGNVDDAVREFAAAIAALMQQVRAGQAASG